MFCKRPEESYPNHFREPMFQMNSSYSEIVYENTSPYVWHFSDSSSLQSKLGQHFGTSRAIYQLFHILPFYKVYLHYLIVFRHNREVHRYQLPWHYALWDSDSGDPDYLRNVLLPLMQEYPYLLR